MNINTTPVFAKVELLFKGSQRDTKTTSITKLEFNDCGLVITGNYLIIVLDETDNIQNTLTSTGKIFHLDEISSYKTHTE
jgi:hypothetical protein